MSMPSDESRISQDLIEISSDQQAEEAEILAQASALAEEPKAKNSMSLEQAAQIAEKIGKESVKIKRIDQAPEIKSEQQKIKIVEAPKEHYTTKIERIKSSTPVVELGQVTERAEGRRNAISMAPMPMPTKHVSASESKPQTPPKSPLFAGLKNADALADKKEISQSTSSVQPKN